MSQSLLTPKMRGVLDRIRRANHTPYHQLPVEQARAAYEAAAEILDLPRAPLPRVENLHLPAADGSLRRARLYAPSHERLPVLLYFHGGGFTIGSIETHDSLCRQLALRAGCAVVSYEYRLAPEHRFPTAVEDCWAALRALGPAAAEWGLDGGRLAVGGDSAGGTLAAVCAILARDHGLGLAAQLLITPGTCAHQDTGSHRLFAQGFVLERAAIDWFFDHYIGHHHRNDWRFAPLNADDLEGVAPAWVCVAECDPLADEGIAYADRLRMAGVAVELDVYRGVTHDFIKMGRAIPEAQEAQAAGAAVLKEAFSS
ncbi:alpha/beta hydrolase [Caldimonas aquatica]|uniref:Alpha/beta hydrolase n=1 Tax=Caldimonas aquatica TaxID=376175 RepID=A0ABY6MMF9_9BURK|nr:alpha/beta hydrolase [Schlegelella aquatica]UZD53624.1 alpha/beta hydrolase [Schlegelella aquatica]